MSNSTIEDRLKSVIASLERQQGYKYNPMTNMTLSYLYDILNDTVPDYVLEIKKTTKELKATIPDGIRRWLDVSKNDKLEWKMETIENQKRIAIVSKKGLQNLSKVN